MLVVDLCLRGIRHAVRIAGIERMEQPLMSFVHCLCKFTGLRQPFKRKGPKEIACIKAVLATALSEGDHLAAAWTPVLRGVSQLARIKAFTDGTEHHHDDGGWFGGSGPTPERDVSEYVCDEIDMRSLDRIFVQSPRLSGSAIADLVTALCAVSRRELDEGELESQASFRARRRTNKRAERKRQYRVFSLQKVVEVADFNISCRGRMTWRRMWSDMAGYFVRVGCHPSTPIALYAVDSLKQLSMKFLEKSEVKGFNFQMTFLRPFETIMETCETFEVRELVLCVMQNICLGRAANVRSGWRSIFRVLKLAGTDDDERLVRLAFSVLDHVVGRCFEHCTTTERDVRDLVDCLGVYAASPVVDGVALVALDHLATCCKSLVRGEVCAGAGKKQRPFKLSRADLIFPVLAAIRNNVTGPVLETRYKSMRVLFETLRFVDSVDGFENALWLRVFDEILFDLFASVRTFVKRAKGGDETDLQRLNGQMTQQDRDSCRLCLNEIVKLFATRLRGGSVGTADKLLALLKDLAAERSLDLACIGVDCLKLFLLIGGEHFSEDTWTQVCAVLKYLFTECAPTELVDILEVYRTRTCQDALQAFRRKRGLLRRRGSSSSSSTRGPPPAPPSSKTTATNVAIGSRVSHATFGEGVVTKRRDHDDIVEVELERCGATLYAPTDSIVSADTRRTREIVAVMFGTPSRLPFDEGLVFTRCKVQLELLPALTSVTDAHMDRLSFSNKIRMLDCLDASANLARDFNEAKEYRELLAQLGFMKHLKLQKLTNLLRQEAAAVQLKRTILLKMARASFEREDATPSARSVRESTEVERRIRGLAERTLTRYMDLDEKVRVHLASLGITHTGKDGEGSGATIAAVRRVEEGRALAFFDRDAVQIVSGVAKLPAELFERYMQWFFPLLVRLVRVQNLDLRLLIMSVLERQVHPLVLRGCADKGM